MVHIRIADPADWPAIEAFLLLRLTSSQFLIGNARAAGVVHTGARYSGDYAIVTDDGAVIGVAAQYWNGNVVLQAHPERVPELVAALLAHSQRAVRGLLGPVDQVRAARDALRIAPERIQLDEPEVLFALDLRNLRVPDALRSGRVVARLVVQADLDVLTDMQIAFAIESLDERDTPAFRQAQRERSQGVIDERKSWLAEVDGRPVAKSNFSTRTAECVQVGGVYTPPALRGHGYARCVVAQSLLDARAAGATQAVLFTSSDNHPAQRAYRSLGFEVVGDYGLLLLREG